jgi:hypothetical protein
MMKKAFYAIAALVSMIAVPAAADLTPYAEAGGWDVYQDTSDCTMTAVYGTSQVMITFDERTDDVTVSFSDPSVKSLKQGDRRDLRTVFIEPGYDDGWGTKSFGVIDMEGTRHFTRVMDVQFLTDMAKYKYVAFFYGDVLLRSYKLEGSALAVRSLRACATKVARLNPSDPFAGEVKADGSI